MPGFSEDHLRQHWIAQHHIITAAKCIATVKLKFETSSTIFFLLFLLFFSLHFLYSNAAPTMAYTTNDIRCRFSLIISLARNEWESVREVQRAQPM